MTREDISRGFDKNILIAALLGIALIAVYTWQNAIASWDEVFDKAEADVSRCVERNGTLVKGVCIDNRAIINTSGKTKP